MCDCPAIDLMCAAVAKLARVRPGTVQAIYARLERDGDRAGRLVPPLIAAAFGWREHVVGRVMASLEELGVTSGRVVTAEWRDNRHAPVTPLRQGPQTGAERQARWRDNHPEYVEIRRARRRLAEADQQPDQLRHAALRQPSSYSLFPVDQAYQQKEQKQTRAQGESNDDGFAALVAIWPLSNRMAEAEREYRRYRQHRTASEILASAQRYIETKEEWRSAQFLMNWLRTDPCRDPQLPLASSPRVVTTTEPLKPRVDWSALGDAWLLTRQWPPDIGPPPDKADCLMPFGLLQKVRKALIDRHSGERASA